MKIKILSFVFVQKNAKKYTLKMANQYKISDPKRAELIYFYFFQRWGLKELAKKFRLNHKTIKRLIARSMKND